MTKLLLIGAGGAIGSVLRHLLTIALQSSTPGSFPFGTLTVNVLGCLAIGVLYSVFQSAWPVREEVRLALVVGVLGGFTTFSSFGLQTFELVHAGKSGQAAAYVALSNVLGLGAVVLGVHLARLVLARSAA